ncbi:MAG TPA: hypothetical protein VGE07_00505 [Herpetosiphonaceae bacterium]
MTTVWLLACRWWLIRWLEREAYYIACDIEREAQAIADLVADHKSSKFGWLTPHYGSLGC